MALSRFLTGRWQERQGKIRGPACGGPGFGHTSPDREIKSQSQRCERIDLNLGGSRILGFVIRSAYFGLIFLRLDFDVLWHVPVIVANRNSCKLC